MQTPIIISATGRQHGFGSDPYKWVSGLTREEQAAVKTETAIVLIKSHPADNGISGTIYRQVHHNAYGYYPRVPSNEILEQILA